MAKPVIILEADSVVGEVMRRSPGTIRVFLDFRMNCVGCPIAWFHTIDDSCREYGVDVQEFLAALRRHIVLRRNTEVRPRRFFSFRRA